MPRPKTTRGASRRAVSAPKNATSPSAPTKSSEPSSDLHNIDYHEKENLRPKRISKAAAAALEISRQRRDSAMSRLENMTSTTSTGNANTEEEDTEDSIEAKVEFGRRVVATPKHGRITEVSGLDLDDDMFDDLNTTINTAGPAIAHLSNDTSTLSMSHLKRRPRAGSFLSRDDGPLRPSSRAVPNTPGYSSTFNIGVFKKRAREPSILGTVQKERPQRPEPESDSSDESHVEPDANDFNPEAESTPLRRSKRHSGAAEVEKVAPQPSSSSANTRKRKSTEGHKQRRRSSPYAESAASDSEVTSSPLSLPPQISRPTTPVMEEEDIPPPESSGSSEGEAEIWPPLQALAKSRPKRVASALRRTPVPEDNPSEMSSPPSLTYSPNYAEPSPPQKATKQTRRGRAASKQEAKTKVTTADLKGLLPRRRQRTIMADPFPLDNSDGEVDASGLGDDDDELSYLDVRTHRRPLSRSSNRSRSVPRGKSGQRKGKRTPGSAKPPVRTYGRSQDKENEEDEEEEGGSLAPMPDDDGTENSEEMVARMGQELKDAARKFQEVDKWALEYEEVLESSSPRDAR